MSGGRVCDNWTNATVQWTQTFSIKMCKLTKSSAYELSFGKKRGKASQIKNALFTTGWKLSQFIVVRRTQYPLPRD